MSVFHSFVVSQKKINCWCDKGHAEAPKLLNWYQINHNSNNCDVCRRIVCLLHKWQHCMWFTYLCRPWHVIQETAACHISHPSNRGQITWLHSISLLGQGRATVNWHWDTSNEPSHDCTCPCNTDVKLWAVKKRLALQRNGSHGQKAWSVREHEIIEHIKTIFVIIYFLLYSSSSSQSTKWGAGLVALIVAFEMSYRGLSFSDNLNCNGQSVRKWAKVTLVFWTLWKIKTQLYQNTPDYSI